MIQVLDFFSGCGGVSAGFSAAGLKPVFALALDRDALGSFALNHPRALIRHQPIEALDHAELARMRAQGVTFFVGCCPCQQFSQLNLTGRTEKRTLVGVFVDTVLRHLPFKEFMIKRATMEMVGFRVRMKQKTLLLFLSSSYLDQCACRSRCKKARTELRFATIS